MSHLDLWGKADPARATLGPSWHPLIAHMLDVAACAQSLLTEARPGSLGRMASFLGVSERAALPWVLLFVVLHDLGKATPAFQAKVAEAKARLLLAGFDFPESDEPHGEMSALLVPDMLTQLGVPEVLARTVGRSVGAHHGEFAGNEHLAGIEEVPRHVGKRLLWSDARKTLVDDLVALIGPLEPLAPGEEMGSRHAFCVDLAGLTTAADWLGSNADVFVYVTPDINLTDYFTSCRRMAQVAVAEAGFRSPPKPPRRSFRQLFEKEPWPLHDAVTNLLESLEPGALIIVEAAMGEGKTEAALLVYDALASHGGEGLFFALPTQATANQILGRVERYMAGSLPGQHGLHLVHGGAGLSEKYDALKARALRTRSVGGVSGADDAPLADAWFCRAKRALLAPFGVGTVDQALLGVLRTKHHFLRLHGLAGKVVVVDEVHAYDAFTSSILARLCEWLEALGTTVVLLSATLSSPQRTKLLAAYGATKDTEGVAYPRLTVARRGEAPRSLSFPARRKPVAVALEWHETEALPALVADRLRIGGCLVWIVNTVARAQSLYVAMKQLVVDTSIDVQLLHARFPMADRLAREARAEAAFGPPGPQVRRPRAALLIGTQVLEQSLDFDFDLMITEIAPVDLVLQRAGRLHRHERDRRPPGLESRTLWLEEPMQDSQGPDFGPTSFVYDEAVMLASYLALKSRSSVEVPTDIEPLVEAVYVERQDQVGDLPVPATLVDRLRNARAERERAAAGEAYQAELKQLPSPEHDSPFGDFSCSYDEEDPAVHEALKAITRLGDPSVTVLPVRRKGSLYALFEREDVTFDPEDADLPFSVARTLARGAIGVSQRALFHGLVHDPALLPRAFRRSGMLGHHRLLVLDDRGCAVVGSTNVSLDSELGLLIGALAADRCDSSPARQPKEEDT